MLGLTNHTEYYTLELTELVTDLQHELHYQHSMMGVSRKFYTIKIELKREHLLFRAIEERSEMMFHCNYTKANIDLLLKKHNRTVAVDLLLQYMTEVSLLETLCFIYLKAAVSPIETLFSNDELQRIIAKEVTQWLQS